MLPTSLEAGATTGMESITTVTTFLWGQITQVVTTIVSTPLLLDPGWSVRRWRRCRSR